MFFAQHNFIFSHALMHLFLSLGMTREDSSGFEHVFVGETKFGNEIMGLHNWVQFYLQEKEHLLDYKGYKARSNDMVMYFALHPIY